MNKAISSESAVIKATINERAARFGEKRATVEMALNSLSDLLKSDTTLTVISLIDYSREKEPNICDGSAAASMINGIKRIANIVKKDETDTIGDDALKSFVSMIYGTDGIKSRTRIINLVGDILGELNSPCTIEKTELQELLILINDASPLYITNKEDFMKLEGILTESHELAKESPNASIAHKRISDNINVFYYSRITHNVEYSDPKEMHGFMRN